MIWRCMYSIKNGENGDAICKNILNLFKITIADNDFSIATVILKLLYVWCKVRQIIGDVIQFLSFLGF